MDIAALYEYCRNKKGVTEGFPFGEDVLVFKVMGKMYALMNLEDVPPRINLKCDPVRALELREQYDAVLPGYHMNKQHWNTVVSDGSIPGDLVRELIDHSYELIVRSLKKAQREALARL
jgi:predicted DNA-binding protein (MmcQ/YjbR family)